MDFTLKYRPQKISELDLIAVKEGLEHVLRSGKIPQAFLFAGPRGTGKTSAARIIAKYVNCLEKEGFEPCNRCEQCLSITAGTNLDVLEIDAASSRGIDDVRDLREKIKLAPTKAEYKVYIVDEVHMLTLEAFNALLKTLEEPPEHAIFILCTTNPEKLPETIISRCMRFNFKRATQAEIVKKLEKIAKAEEIEIERTASQEIARAVKGSFRDANRILEQVSFSGTRISQGQVKNLLGQTVGLTPEKLIGFLVQRDTRGGIAEIAHVVETGANLRFYTQELLETLRMMLLEKYGLKGEEEKKFESALSVENLLELIEIFSRAARALKEAIIPQLPLELAVVEWCDKEIKSEKFPPKADQPLAEKIKNYAPLKPILVSSPKVSTASRSGNISFGEIQARWPELLAAVKPKNHSLAAFLRATRPIGLANQCLTIEVFYKFHKDQLETERNRRLVEEVIQEIFKTALRLKCILGERKTPPPLKKNPDNGDAVEEDILKVAEEIFNGVVDIE